MSAPFATPSRRAAPRAAFAVVVAAVTIATFALPASHAGEALPTRMMAVAFALAGLLATRRPEGRTLGWLMLAVGGAEAAVDLLSGYAEAVLPGAVWAYWVTQWIGFFVPALMLIYLPLLFPSGRLLSPRWRWVSRGGGTLLVLAIVGAAVHAEEPYVTERTGVVLGHNPLGVPALAGISDAFFIVIVVGALVLAMASLTSLAIRWRRGTPIERLQIRWLLFGIATLIVSLLALVVIGISDLPVSETVIDLSFGLAALVVPVSVLVALTRHRLYELDRVVSRTLTYATVVALVVVIYLGAVTAVTAVTSPVTGDSPLSVAVATLLAATAFQPARRRIQTAVDRRFNRARYDAARTVESYRGRLREQLDLEAITADLAHTAAAVMEPRGVTVWLRAAGRS